MKNYLKKIINFNKINKISLQSIFKIILLLSVFSLVTVGSLGLYYNAKIIDNQQRTISALDIETLRFKMSDSLTKLLERQQLIIASRTIDELKQIPNSQGYKNDFLEASKKFNNFSNSNRSEEH